MTTLPDPTAIDWTSIAGWAGGVVTVLASIGFAIWQAIKRAAKIAETLPSSQISTKIVTADTVAMDRLAATVEASNMVMQANNVLRQEEHADRTANRASLEANTEAMNRLATSLNELRTDVRNLTFEIVRSAK